MNSMLIRSLALPLLTVMACTAQTPVAPQKETVLFNGKDLTGWYVYLRDTQHQDPKNVFSVTDGLIRISGEDWGGLATRESYRDYHLIVEWRWGTKTWGSREKRTRDSGILVHAVGEDGAAGRTWLESIESQVIEGGSGDIILVAGKNRPSATAKVRVEGRETYWDKNGSPVTRDSGRINWWGRSPQWRDELGFRGEKDVENRPGEWNRQEVYADGDKITCVLNGTVVNHIYNLSHKAGKIQIQSEGAEIFIRKVELRPIEKVPSAE